MKRLALVFITATSFATANAQFAFGVKAGGNFSTLTGDVDGAQTLFGFNAGAYVKLPLARFVSLQPELVYSGQGATYNTGDGTESQHLNYVNVPILLKFAHRSGLYLETGPQAGFLLSANDKLAGNSTDIKSDLKSADFAWVFGFGFKVPRSPLGIDFRYNAGLSNIVSDQQVNPGGNTQTTVHNGVFQIGLTYVLFHM
jgi:Outer membrane protein beta-barrel domain